jgi:hypothetical protein
LIINGKLLGRRFPQSAQRGVFSRSHAARRISIRNDVEMV